MLLIDDDRNGNGKGYSADNSPYCSFGYGDGHGHATGSGYGAGYGPINGSGYGYNMGYEPAPSRRRAR